MFYDLHSIEMFCWITSRRTQHGRPVDFYENKRFKMSPIVFLTVLLAGCATGSPIANQYFDNLLFMAVPREAQILNLENATVSNFSSQFEDKVAIIGKVKGNADYFNGRITGLTNARRYSECNGPYYSFGVKNYNCTIVLDKISVNYEGKLKYGKMPKVDIKGKSNVTNTLVLVEVSQANLRPTLKNFNVQQMGSMQVKFTGLGPLNRFTKVLEDGFKGHLTADVFYSVSQRYRNAWDRAISQVPFP